MKPAPQTVFRLASLPGRPADPAHLPYLSLFYDALKPHGVTLVSELVPTAGWLKRHAQEIDAIHIHWPEMIWRNENRPFFNSLRTLRGYYFFRKVTQGPRSLLGLLRLRALLRCVRLNKLRVLWTVHELEPHSGFSRVDRIGCAILARHSDLIICHSETTRNAFISMYGCAGQTLVMNHGNFQEAYPAPRPRTVVLNELGLDVNLPVVCILGTLRKYKGIDLAMDAVAELKGKVQLIIAGEPHAEFPAAAVSQRLSMLANAILIPRHLLPQEFSDLASCSEAFLLPYRKITTSGVMQAAFTFHCGIVATNLPYFQETLRGDPDCGRLSESDDPVAFAAAISEYLQIPKEVRTRAARNFSERYRWERVILPVVAAIRNFRNRG